ncbi:MAG: hypothetical protein JOY66_03760 [Acetobacteraceae bacterium]|nr:hypothetical protein [Acetobacteraceae bacterium]
MLRSTGRTHSTGARHARTRGQDAADDGDGEAGRAARSGRPHDGAADTSGLVSGTQPGDTSAATGSAGGVGSLGPRGIGTGAGPSGMSGAPTNDTAPGGGMTGEREQRDIPKHDAG